MYSIRIFNYISLSIWNHITCRKTKINWKITVQTLRNVRQGYDSLFYLQLLSVCKEAPGLLLGLWSWYTKSLGNGSLASNPVLFSFFFWSSNHDDWCAQHSFIAGNAMYKIRPEQFGKTQFAGGEKKKSMCIPFHCFSVPPPTLYLWNPDQFLNDRSSLKDSQRPGLHGMQPHQLEVARLHCLST